MLIWPLNNIKSPYHWEVCLNLFGHFFQGFIIFIVECFSFSWVRFLNVPIHFFLREPIEKRTALWFFPQHVYYWRGSQFSFFPAVVGQWVDDGSVLQSLPGALLTVLFCHLSLLSQQGREIRISPPWLRLTSPDQKFT